MCVSTGVISVFTSLRTEESISSIPQEDEVFMFDNTSSTRSGCTAVSSKEQALFFISFLTSLRGSPILTGKFFRSFSTLLMKNEFIILAKSEGLL